MTWLRCRFDVRRAESKKRPEILLDRSFINMKSTSKIQLTGCSARQKTQQYLSIAGLFNAAMRLIIGCVKVICGAHAETTAVVQWHDDFETGHTWPQTSWDAGFLWLGAKAPMASWDSFQDYIRAACPKTATRWDAADAAEAEFGFAATPDEVAAIQAAQERVAAEKAEYEAEQAEKRAASPFAKLAKIV